MGKPASRSEPGRREAIIIAALDVILEHGTHQTTHRLIAERAGVPLGSLTYYFDGLTRIIEEAFGLLSARMAALYRDKVQAVSTREGAIDAVVDLICGGNYAAPRDITGLFEMYAFGNHNAKVWNLCRDWLATSRESLSLHFQESTTLALDALIEGWPMHQAWEARAADPHLVRTVVSAIVERLEPREPIRP